ncbi:hypothetical protein WR25_27263 [Diploscapter pachys]|uniref:Uncharacterized protein n=1 Tax=Diploscapter pachys TaxID=2018661 RepID=A0A2A2KJH4_9BILA|nr:hypothetical protein WR25_27263 [Diploscapter pachys]
MNESTDSLTTMAITTTAKLLMEMTSTQSTEVWNSEGMDTTMQALTTTTKHLMEKDFMRTITNTMFIPLLIGDLFNTYVEVADYFTYFKTSHDEMKQFHKEYIEWTANVTYVLFDFNHYNVFMLMPLMLYCCHLACLPNDRINAFPTKMICLLLQVIPFFLSVHRYLEVGDASESAFVTLFGYLSRIFTIFSFIILTFTIFWSAVPISKELPYEAANSTDMQIRDARSRLAWTLAYMIIPYLSFVPYQVRSVLWLTGIDKNEADETVHKLVTVCELLVYLSSYYRAAVMCVITMTCLPPYRRAVPLLFCCCSCCPHVNVEPLPRKEQESTLMYRFADL